MKKSHLDKIFQCGKIDKASDSHVLLTCIFGIDSSLIYQRDGQETTEIRGNFH